MINTSKLSTPAYPHTLDAHIMYYLKITGNWSHIYMYIHYLPAIEYTYLILDAEATTCQSLKYINTWIHMTPCDENEIRDEFHYLFICPVFQKYVQNLLH